ncbi:MAG: restriction endonuclease [Candidatus Binatia bacterium]
MVRRYTFNRLVSDIAREAARRERQRQKEGKERQREMERAQREAARLQKQLEKEAKQRYIEERMGEAEEKNTQLNECISELSGVLEYTLEIDDTMSFDGLRIQGQFREFTLPPELESPPPKPELETYLASVKKPTVFNKLVPGTQKRYEAALQLAEKEYQTALEKYESQLTNREARIEQLRNEYEREKQAYELKIQQRNQEIDEFEKAYFECDPTAVNAYCTMVLERSEYPDDFPQEFRVAYLPDPKELVIEYELPSTDIIPTVAEYRYVKTRDAIDEKSRKAAEIKSLYQDIVASICLRTVHEMFEADQGNNLEVVVFNGFVQTVDPATGQDVRPCLISVRTTKERFNGINLSRIDKKACLRNLGAQVSPRPAEMQPVKPVVEFDMVDNRFVEQSDVLSDLESRPNLMDLNPYEFENFISNLFDQIGFQAKLTRSSKDGGVDVIAYDPRPLLGGKVVIQAKRYKNVVGVSAVRDLYGTMINEGASKGVLVTTSHYGPDTYDFANDKPIELIDGGGLLYLLEQQGVKARIIFPED